MPARNVRRIHRVLRIEELEPRIAPVVLVDGLLDPSFGADGKVTTDIDEGDDHANALVVDANSHIDVAGVGYVGGSNRSGVGRYSSGGAPEGVTPAPQLPGGSHAGAGGMARQSDDKMVTGGWADNGSDYDFALARYNSDGTLDTAFGDEGMATTDFGGDDYANDVAIQSDGKIVVAGWTGGNFALARYNSDGSLDTTFDGDGMLTTDFGGSDGAYAVAIQSDGKIVAAGNTDAGGNYDFALARYNADGSSDTTFDGDGMVTTDFDGGDDDAYDIAIQSDGKIVVVGDAIIGSTSDFGLARYNSDGSLDTTFNGDGKTTTDFGAEDGAYGVALQSDGRIVAVGCAGDITGGTMDFALARYNKDGSLDTTFDGDGKVTTDFGGGNDYAYDVAIQSDGKIVAVGAAWNGSDYDFALARYHSSTVLYEQDFSSGKPGIGDGWEYYSSVGGGRIQVVGGALRMDSNGTYCLNEAIWHVDLSGEDNLLLEFQHRDSKDEANPLPDPGADWVSHDWDGDGIAISDDGGATWSTVLSLGRNTDWTSYTLDLDDAIATAGMTYSSDFRIKFQQYDNHWWGLDGREFDNLAIRRTDAPPIDYEEDFSDGKPGEMDGWQYYSSYGGGRIRVVNGALRMDSDGTYNLNEAILTLNLAGQSDVELRFDHRDSYDEPTAMPTEPWSGHAEGDGVAISDDGGAHWYSIVSLGRELSWTTHTIDLDAMIAAAGMSYSANFQIKFQQYDNHWWGLDGREFDNIIVRASAPAECYGWAVGDSDGGFGTILFTPDGGETWVRQGNADAIPDADMQDVAAINEHTAWVVGQNGTILRTENSGATWIPQIAPVAATGLLKISAVSELVAWAVGVNGVIVHTDDGGATWAQQGVGQVPVVHYQGVYALDDQHVWVTGDKQDGYGVIVYSSDGGATWVRQGSAVTVPDTHLLDIVVLDSGAAWVAGHGPDILYSADFGENWAIQYGSMDPEQWLFDANGVYAVNENTAWTVADSGLILHTTDGGATWNEQPTPTAAYVMSVDALNAQMVWAVGTFYYPSGGVLLHSTDGGETWETQTAPVDVRMSGVMFVR